MANNRQLFKLRLAQVLSWLMVIFWMGVIFWFSSQPAQDSARLSIGVMRLGGEVISNWQLVGIIAFVIFYHLFLVWLVKIQSHVLLKVLLFAVFLALSAVIVYVLYTMVRPRVSAFGIFEMNRWVIHLYLRKYAHFIVYLFLGSFLMNALTLSNIRGWKAFGIAVVVSFLYAVSDEFHQYFVPGRTALFLDVVIDTAGASVGIALYGASNALMKLFRKKRPRT